MAPDDQEASDAQLAARARDGDGGTFAVLCERFFPKVFGFLARLLGERSAAEEIPHDAFVTADDLVAPSPVLPVGRQVI